MRAVEFVKTGQRHAKYLDLVPLGQAGGFGLRQVHDKVNQRLRDSGQLKQTDTAGFDQALQGRGRRGEDAIGRPGTEGLVIGDKFGAKGNQLQCQ